MTDHRSVYKQEGDRYHQLISREDFEGNLLPALENILDLNGLDVFDLGAGTGRLTKMLSPRVNSIHAFDLSSHMLEVAARDLHSLDKVNWEVTAADHRRIPRCSNTADLIISGWSVCYLVVWAGDDWKHDLDVGLNEMKRLARDDGTIVIIESLGTGIYTPDAPEKLREYFYYLEKNGFQRSWIRTDYKFKDWDEAADLTEFFFGQEMLEKIDPGKYPILPECTGIWYLSLDGGTDRIIQR